MFRVSDAIQRMNYLCNEKELSYIQLLLIPFFPLVCPLKFSDKEMIISDRYVPMKLFTQGSIADHQLNGRAF